MKTTLITVGTRGDVQPYLLLGRELATRGQRVTLATHVDYEVWIRGEGLDFAPIGGSFKALVESADGRDWIDSSDNLRRYIETSKRLFYPLFDVWSRDMLAAGTDADAVVLHPYAMFGGYPAEQRKRPRVFAPFLPVVPASRYIEPVFMPRTPAVGPLRRWVTELSAHSLWTPFMHLHQSARAQLGLPPFRTKNPWSELLGERFPIVNLYSEALIPRPPDWPSFAHVTGFVLDPEPTNYVPPPALSAFLDAGPPPVYIGFGSMTGRNPVTLARVAVRALQLSGQRGLLATGWGGMRPDELPPHVFPLPEVPHAWLFERVSAVVHHGGVGTTAAGLRAGRPTLVCAFFGDQPFFGLRVHAIGAGPKPIVRRQLDADLLASRIGDLVSNAQYRENARRIGERLAAEGGTSRAADVIEGIFAAC